MSRLFILRSSSPAFALGLDWPERGCNGTRHDASPDGFSTLRLELREGEASPFSCRPGGRSDRVTPLCTTDAVVVVRGQESSAAHQCRGLSLVLRLIARSAPTWSRRSAGRPNICKNSS